MREAVRAAAGTARSPASIAPAHAASGAVCVCWVDGNAIVSHTLMMTRAPSGTRMGNPVSMWTGAAPAATTRPHPPPHGDVRLQSGRPPLSPPPGGRGVGALAFPRAVSRDTTRECHAALPDERCRPAPMYRPHPAGEVVPLWERAPPTDGLGAWHTHTLSERCPRCQIRIHCI